MIRDKPPQNRICYTPDKHFYAFDLKVYPARAIGWVPLDQALQWFESAGLFAARILRRATYEELIQWDVETMQTTIPERLGYSIPDEHRQDDRFLAEGVMLRRERSRFRLKKKRQAFREDQGSRPAPPGVPPTVMAKINEVRWNSLRSKHGEPSTYPLPQWADLMLKDIHEESPIEPKSMAPVRRQVFDFLRPRVVGGGVSSCDTNHNTK